MYKRGQVTIFLVVGIVILAIFAGVFYTISVFRKESLISQNEDPLIISIKSQITAFVESCIRETALPGIYLLGIQGGIIYPENPPSMLVTENALINYGYLDGVVLLSTEKAEEEINRYVEENLPYCLGEFENFLEEGIIITEGSGLSADSKILSEGVFISLVYELEASRGSSELSLDHFSVQLPLSVGKIFSEAKAIITQHENNPGRIDLSFLSNLDSFATAFPFDEATTVYSLSDEMRSSFKTPFTMMFAIRDYQVNTPPRLEPIPDIAIRKGEPLLLEFTAEDDEEDLLTYSSDSAQFPLSEEGTMKVIPTAAGKYQIAITVKDKSGLEDTKNFQIAVIENE